MPIIEVTYGSQLADEQLRELARCLPHAVSVAVECPEEPYDHDLRPGDVELRFRPSGPLDVSGLDVVVEVRSKWFASRAETRQERCDQIRDSVTDVVGPPCTIGVYLSLPVAAWSQVNS
jgi:hypothetical protein